jgi:hypothetical protein
MSHFEGEPMMLIESVMFKRTKDSEWEFGIIINNDQLIVDSNAKPVSVRYKLWDYRRTHRLLVEVDMSNPVPKGKE